MGNIEIAYLGRRNRKEPMDRKYLEHLSEIFIVDPQAIVFAL